MKSTHRILANALRFLDLSSALFLHCLLLAFLLLSSDVGISLPTFIIAECVLIYLDPDSTRNIVGWASKRFSTAIFFLYEQVLVFFGLIFIFNILGLYFSYFVACSLNWCSVLWLWVHFSNGWFSCGWSTDPPRWCFWTANDQKSWGNMDPIFDHSVLNSFDYHFSAAYNKNF